MVKFTTVSRPSTASAYASSTARKEGDTMTSQERIHHIEALFRRSTRYYRASSALLGVCALLMIYGLYEVTRCAITGGHDALHFALTSVLLALLIDRCGRLILTPYWHRSLAELEEELEKAETEMNTSA
jgi:hypothetical protein